MEGIVCGHCLAFSPEPNETCQSCAAPLIYKGQEKNIIDRLIPDCLIYRYAGSDKLEPAKILKIGRTNVKVATQLSEYNAPVSVAKTQIYQFDHQLYSAIQALRNERTSTIKRYDLLIGHHWQKLSGYFTS